MSVFAIVKIAIFKEFVLELKNLRSDFFINNFDEFFKKQILLNFAGLNHITFDICFGILFFLTKKFCTINHINFQNSEIVDLYNCCDPNRKNAQKNLCTSERARILRYLNSSFKTGNFIIYFYTHLAKCGVIRVVNSEVTCVNVRLAFLFLFLSLKKKMSIILILHIYIYSYIYVYIIKCIHN